MELHHQSSTMVASCAAAGLPLVNQPGVPGGPGTGREETALELSMRYMARASRWGWWIFQGGDARLERGDLGGLRIDQSLQRVDIEFGGRLFMPPSARLRVSAGRSWWHRRAADRAC